MTVRVNKSAFNIREKLSELAVKFGLKGSELMRAETAQEARDLVSAGRRNLVMNGAMQIAQRGTSFPNSQSFTLDRWHFGGGSTTGEITVTQQSSNSAPGHANYIQGNVDVADASIAGTEYVMCSINIEGYQARPLCWGTSYAKPATISFWHKHSIAGTYSIILRSTDANYNYLIDYTQNTADVWQKSTFVIKPPTSGSWDKSTGIGLRLGFTMTNGTTYQSSTIENWFSGQYYHSTPNQVQMMQTLNAKFRLTGIQLEVGENATDFDYIDYHDELRSCMRFYQIYRFVDSSYQRISPALVPGTSTSTQAICFLYLKERLRTVPSIGNIGFSAANTFRMNGGGQIDQVAASVAASTNGQGDDVISFDITYGTARTSGLAGWVSRENISTTYIIAEAEF